MRTNILIGSTMRRIRNFLAVAPVIFVASCAVPPAGSISVTDLEQQHAEVKAKQQTLANLAASLKSQTQQIKSRERSLAQQEQQLALARQAIEEEKQSLQRAEFKAQVVPNETPVAPTESLIVGELERVFLSPPGVTMDARIDTGSEISQLSALSATEFERDGKPYVRFTLQKPNTSETLEITRRIRDQIRVKGPNGKSYKRDVVRLRVILGKIDERVDFILQVQPQEQSTKVTIGRNVLRDLAIVDVSKQFVTVPQM